jgi:hypothetical protein
MKNTANVEPTDVKTLVLIQLCQQDVEQCALLDASVKKDIFVTVKTIVFWLKNVKNLIQLFVSFLWRLDHAKLHSNVGVTVPILVVALSSPMVDVEVTATDTRLKQSVTRPVAHSQLQNQNKRVLSSSKKKMSNIFENQFLTNSKS